MAKHIVDDLEAIEIQTKHCQPAAGARAQFQSLRQTVVQQAAIRQAGQSIMKCELADFASACLRSDRSRTAVRVAARPSYSNGRDSTSTGRSLPSARTISISPEICVLGRSRLRTFSNEAATRDVVSASSIGSAPIACARSSPPRQVSFRNFRRDIRRAERYLVCRRHRRGRFRGRGEGGNVGRAPGKPCAGLRTRYPPHAAHRRGGNADGGWRLAGPPSKGLTAAMPNVSGASEGPRPLWRCRYGPLGVKFVYGLGGFDPRR